MKNFLNKILLFIFLLMPSLALAQDKPSSFDLLNNAAKPQYEQQVSDIGTDVTGGVTNLVVQQVTDIVQIVLQAVGLILLIIIIYGGILWLTAGGNDGKVAEAKKWITNGVIGVIIVSLSYAIALFIEGFAR